MELTVSGVLKNSIKKGTKYAVAIVVNAVLWLLTIWIPYLNVGTTIGLFVGIVAKISRDEPISMTEIFDKKYRKRMGEFFLTGGLVYMGSYFAAVFMVVPGIVIGIAWSLAVVLVVDREMNPMEAIHHSNTITYGRKWTIFLSYLVVFLVVAIAAAIILWILGMISSFLATLGSIVMGAVFISIMISIQGYIYQVLTADASAA